MSVNHLVNREGFFSLRHTVFKESQCDDNGSPEQIVDLCRRIQDKLSKKEINDNMPEANIKQFFAHDQCKKDLNTTAQFLTG